MRFGTQHVLIRDLLGSSMIPQCERDAAHILGRVKQSSKNWQKPGTDRRPVSGIASDLGTRSHFLSSLCASADRVYLRSNT